jgi:hypothetical protein
MSDLPSTIRCPICDGNLGVMPHQSGSRWTDRQRWLVLKLDAIGLTNKMIGRILSDGTLGVRGVACLLDEMRKPKS